MRNLGFALLLTLTTQFCHAQNDTCLTTLDLGISFPPVQVDSQRVFSATHMNTLGMTKLRFGDQWAFREPSPGVFNWTALDERIDWVDTNNLELLLTIQSNGPAWACSSTQNPQSCVFNDNNEFKNYIETLLQRYSGKIDKIQFGNEWQALFWYAGAAGEFIAANNVLYDAVQAYSPSTKVVLGGFTTISLRWSAGCNGAVYSVPDDLGVLFDSTYFVANCNTQPFIDVRNRIDSVLTYAKYDMLDIHLYDDVDQWDEYYFNFVDTISKPVIVSEFGGPNMNYEPYTEAYQADQVFKYIKKLDSIQISEAYFFKLIEGGGANIAHVTSGLLDSVLLSEKPAYDIFAAFAACPTASIGETYVDENEIMIFPNPTSAIITMLLGEVRQGITAYVRNSLGKLIHTEFLGSDERFTLNLPYPPGVYIIEIVGSNFQAKPIRLLIK